MSEGLYEPERLENRIGYKIQGK